MRGWEIKGECGGEGGGLKLIEAEGETGADAEITGEMGLETEGELGVLTARAKGDKERA